MSKKRIQLIAKTEPSKWIERYGEFSVDLADWLTRTATLPARSGLLERRHHEFTLDQSKLVEILEVTTSPERDPSNIPIGLFYSLTKVIDPAFLSNRINLHLMNPQDWDSVLRVYLEIMKASKDIIAKASPEVLAANLAELDSISKIVEDAMDVFVGIANSEVLLKKLIQNYQDQLTSLNNKIIEKSKEITKTNFPKEIVLTLTESGEENLNRLIALPNHAELARQVNVNISWLGIPTRRRQDLYSLQDEFSGSEHSSIPQGELGLVFDQNKFNVINSHAEVRKEFNAIQSNIKYAIVNAYKETHTVLAYFVRFIPIRGEARFYSVYYCPSIEINNQLFPMMQINLFGESPHIFTMEGDHIGMSFEGKAGGECRYWDNACKVRVPHYRSTIEDTYRSFREVNSYTRFDHAFSYCGSRSSVYRHRNEFDDHQYLLAEKLEKNILVPARKSFAKTILNQQDVVNIYQPFLQLQAFIQFLDSSFIPNKNNLLMQFIMDEILRLSETGEVQHLKNIKAALHDNAWKDIFSNYIPSMFHLSSVENFVSFVQSRLSRQPAWRMLVNARTQLKTLKHSLNSVNEEMSEQELVTSSASKKFSNSIWTQPFVLASSLLFQASKFKSEHALVTTSKSLENFPKADKKFTHLGSALKSNNPGFTILCDGPPKEIITRDPVTGEYVFDYSITYQGKEIAGMMLYGNKEYCQLDGKNNILEQRRIFKDLNLRPFQANLCSVLPPTLSDIALDSAIQGIAMGGIRGVANVLGGKNSWHATGIFYGSYYLYRLYETFQQKPDQDYWSAVQQAGGETLWLAGLEVALSQVSKGMKTAGDYLQQMKQSSVQIVGKTTSKLSSIVGYSSCAYEGIVAWQASPTPFRTLTQLTTRYFTSITTGFVSQKATEKLGTMISGAAGFFKRSKQLQSNTKIEPIMQVKKSLLKK